MKLVTRRSRIALLAATTLCLALLNACGKKEDDEEDEDAPGATGAVAPTGGETLPEAPDVVLSLFKDTADIAPSDLASDTSDCLGIDSVSSFSDAVEPWPAGLKAFLAHELAKFPEFDVVTNAVAGIYLAKADMLAEPGGGGGGVVAGIMCGSNTDNRGHIFINYQLYVPDRLAVGPLDEYQDMVSAVSPYVLSEHGDQAVYTLIHEIFHAIDNLNYLHTDDATQIDGRNAVLDLAWNSAGDSLDPRADIYTLSRTVRRHACPARGFSLSPETPEEHMAAYKTIAEDTNFISPYAQSNPFEDFADTLATWYFRLTYNNGLVRSVYRDDLSTTPLASAELIYKFDTIDILRTSTRHREKMCAMVDLVFDAQECTAQLDAP